MADRQTLTEENSYDVATIHIEAVDQNDNHLSYYQEPLVLRTEGAIGLIGPSIVTMRGGYAGTYVRSLGYDGEGKLFISSNFGEAVVEFSVAAGQKV